MRANTRLAWFLLALALTALGLSLWSVLERLPLSGAAGALLYPDPLSLADTIVHDSILPRILLAWAAGAGLGAATVLLQRVLQNPLGSATTFGLSGGAGVAIATALLLAPASMAGDRFPVALVGVALVMAVVVGFASRQRLSPAALALCGLLLSLFFGAALTCLFLLQGKALGALAIWGAGSLDQGGWPALRHLAPRLGFGLLAALPLLGPLHLLSLDDTNAGARGVPVFAIRLAAVVVTVWIAAAVVAAVGAIGFVDLATVAVLRLGGARTVRQQFVWVLPTGAVMLWLADGLAQHAEGLVGAAVPTGAVTGLLGAPILVLLARQVRTPLEPGTGFVSAARRKPAFLLAGLILALGPAILIGLGFGRTVHGWAWSTGSELSLMLTWRWPRVIGAAASGALLAQAGVLTQRLTANPLATPELLGVGAVASLATIVLLAINPAASKPAVLLVNTGACAGALVMLLAVARRNLFSPTALLLAGVGVTAALGTALNLILAVLPLDSARILSWIGGSTYFVGASDASVVAALALCAIAALPVLGRWLDILPLGPAVSTALGVDLARARLVVVLFAALLVGSATVIVGPFAFIGLIAPQLARMAGCGRAVGQTMAAALIGAFLLVIADVLGRNLLFPYQIPAGAMASLIGLTPTLVLVRRLRPEAV